MFYGERLKIVLTCSFNSYWIILLQLLSFLVSLYEGAGRENVIAVITTLAMHPILQ